MHLQDTLEERHQEGLREFLCSLHRSYELHLTSGVLWHENHHWQVDWRVCIDNLLLIPLDAPIIVEHDDHTEQVEPGQLALIPPDLRHAFHAAPDATPFRQIAFHFHLHHPWHPPLIPRFAKRVMPLPYGLPAWEERLQDLVWAMNSRRLAGLLGVSVIKELLGGLILTGQPFDLPPEAIDDRIREALGTIHAHYASEVTVHHLAGQAELSEVQFRKLFLRETGRSPKNYIQQYRLSEAAKLLRNSNDPVQTIAYACGFSSDAYFHRVFRQAYHCTPLDLRLRRRAMG